jgi:uncharacterized protein YjbJ (UPF0337 family)
VSIFDDIGGFAVKLGKGLVKEFVGNIFGDKEPTEEDRVKIAKLEELAVQRVQQNLEQLKIEVSDRIDARAREIAIIKSGQKDKTLKILGLGIVASFISAVFLILLGVGKVESVLAGTLIGYLSAKAEQVVSYYFGSSSGSKSKDEVIQKLSSNGK